MRGDYKRHALGMAEGWTRCGLKEMQDGKHGIMRLPIVSNIRKLTCKNCIKIINEELST